MMNLNETIRVKGCITKEISLKGKTLSEIERILGFHPGRLREGMTVLALKELPNISQFELLGYTQVPTHKHDRQKALEGLNETKLKELAMETFTLDGINKLVKVIPAIKHNNAMSDDEQYPSGEGVPQWKLTTSLLFKVIANVMPGQRYL